MLGGYICEDLRERSGAYQSNQLVGIVNLNASMAGFHEGVVASSGYHVLSAFSN